MSGFQDFNGQPIARGARLTVDGAFATVLSLSGPNGDAFYCTPSMVVRFDVDSTEERLRCEVTDGGAIECDDAHVLVSSPLLELAFGLAKREWGPDEAGLA